MFLGYRGVTGRGCHFLQARDLVVLLVEVLLKVLIRLLKARLKVLLKVFIRLLKARLKVLLKVPPKSPPEGPS